MYQYENIILTVKDNFPEIEEKKMELLGTDLSEQIASEDSPYVFFPVFWKLFEYALIGKIKDNGIINRITTFMENMANSDAETRNLMSIEMLEPLFGLKYEVYEKVVSQHLLPESLKIHKEQLRYFRAPTPS